MVLTKEDYVSAISEFYPNQKIKLVTLMETIIRKYGKNDYMTENELEKILNIVIGKEGTDIAFAVNNELSLQRKFNFHYDTQLGQGFITLK